MKDNKHIRNFNEHQENLNANESLDIHRVGLIELYENQIQDAGPFMTIVLEEAIRKLRDTNLRVDKIEYWVVRLEKSWRTI